MAKYIQFPVELNRTLPKNENPIWLKGRSNLSVAVWKSITTDVGEYIIDMPAKDILFSITYSNMSQMSDALKYYYPPPPRSKREFSLVCLGTGGDSPVDRGGG